MKVLSETVRGMEEKEQKLTETGGRRKRDYLSLMANLLTATLFSTPIYTSNVTIYPETHTHRGTHMHTHTTSPLARFNSPAVGSGHISCGFRILKPWETQSEPETSLPETTSTFSQLVCSHNIVEHESDLSPFSDPRQTVKKTHHPLLGHLLANMSRLQHQAAFVTS